MKYVVRISRRAWQDADAIFAWLAGHSAPDAARWFDAMLAAAQELTENPYSYGVIPEPVSDRHTVRQRLFKTPRGRSYRLIFTVIDQRVFVLRIRGPGQPLLSQEELDADL